MPRDKKKSQLLCEWLYGKFPSASYFFNNAWKLRKRFFFGRKTYNHGQNI